MSIEKNFRILDLFCGAGGMSYGMHQNPHFQTVVALDVNEKLAITLKNNMPTVNLVVGDIRKQEIKDEVVDLAIKNKVNMIIGGPPCQGYSMTMNSELFSMTTDEKKELLRGIADVTGYIRRSNMAYGVEGFHRVYIEIPGNWQMVIDISNMLKDLDIPVQTIDFGHPNFRDSNLKMYNLGKPYYWKKEHQVKICANEFLPIGFNILHKQKALEKYSEELLEYLDENKTHKFYWEKPIRRRENKPIHPMENDVSLPAAIRGKHYDSWTDLAKDLGYGE